jgi:uncharacterized protein YecT (DUF1311 family)
MTLPMRSAALFLAFFCCNAFAQYSGPAVQACLDLAKREQKRDGGSARDVVFERDPELILERYTRKLGSQFVASILTGNGAVVYDGAPSAELSFICLLASDKQPVFFDWLPRRNATAAVQCVRSPDLQKNPRDCLALLLRVAEQDLTQAYAMRFQEANERGEKPLAAFRKSGAQWIEYRDAECARRRDLAPAAMSPDDFALACTIDLTRRRALDMR